MHTNWNDAIRWLCIYAFGRYKNKWFITRNHHWISFWVIYSIYGIWCGGVKTNGILSPSFIWPETSSRKCEFFFLFSVVFIPVHHGGAQCKIGTTIYYFSKKKSTRRYESGGLASLLYYRYWWHCLLVFNYLEDFICRRCDLMKRAVNDGNTTMKIRMMMLMLLLYKKKENRLRTRIFHWQLRLQINSLILICLNIMTKYTVP